MAVVYNLDVRIKSCGYIFDAKCECAAGNDPTTHCEHVCGVFEAIQGFSQNKNVEISKYIPNLCKHFTGSKNILVKIKNNPAITKIRMTLDLLKVK